MWDASVLELVRNSTDKCGCFVRTVPALEVFRFRSRLRSAAAARRQQQSCMPSECRSTTYSPIDSNWRGRPVSRSVCQRIVCRTWAYGNVDWYVPASRISVRPTTSRKWCAAKGTLSPSDWRTSQKSHRTTQCKRRSANPLAETHAATVPSHSARNTAASASVRSKCRNRLEKPQSTIK